MTQYDFSGIFSGMKIKIMPTRNPANVCLRASCLLFHRACEACLLVNFYVFITFIAQLWGQLTDTPKMTVHPGK